MNPQAKRLLAIASALAAATLILYFRNLIGGATFVGRDHLTLVTPARHFLGETLAAGRIPQWWDGVGMGTAFAANPMYGTFYPLAWLAALAPGSVGADLVIVVHVFLLGFGVACWSRRLGALPVGATLAGMIAMSCGYTASMAVNGVPLLTMAWLPWVAWATDILCTADSRRARLRAALGVAAVLALTILSGDPAGAISAGLLAIVVATTRSARRLQTFAFMAAAALVALLLASIVLLPALHLLADSSRAGGLDFTEASSWSMHPLRFLEWVWPQALGDASELKLNLASAYANSSHEEFFGSGWSISMFISLPVLVFAFTSGHRNLALASLLFVVLALGSFTPFYAMYRAVFLPEQVIRYPERHLAGALVLWSALAGVGFGRALSSVPTNKALKRWTVAACVFAALALLAWMLGGVAVSRLKAGALAHGVDAEASWSELVFGGFFASLCFALLVAGLWLRRREGMERWSYALAAAALLLPLARESLRTQRVIPRSLVSDPPALLAPVMPSVAASDARPRLYRHVSVNPYLGDANSSMVFASQYQTAIPNTATAYGFAYVPGYEASLGTRLRSTWEYSTQHGTRLLQLYDIEYAYMQREVAIENGLEVVSSVITPNLVLARQRQRRPRAFVAERWRYVKGQDEVLPILFGEAVDLGSVTLIGNSKERPSEVSAGPPSQCELQSDVPELVTLRCSSALGGYAVLLDAWQPGWQASVDGEPRTIEVADAVARAVRIPKGTHTIVFRYQTPGLRLGAWLSCAAWVLLLLGFFLTRRQEVAGVHASVAARSSAV